MEYAICSHDLTRKFGKRAAVQALNIAIASGRITAFLGPNGAGKTTTIRLLLGMLKPSSGTCEVLGHPPGHVKALAQLGAMVESPSLYDHLTGRENLEITRLMRNAPRSELERVLNLVNLTQDARRPVREYSLGMRQRLGLALALMGEPKLLILDEPTNGLDPEGIREMRDLIRRLPRETGVSIFISSHILAEMEQVASDVVVIHKGRLRYQGPMEGLGTEGESRLQIKVDAPAKAAEKLALLGKSFERSGNNLLVLAGPEEAPSLAKSLVEEGLGLQELLPAKRSLEDRFLALLEEP